MLIESSSITMRSEHRKQERYERNEKLEMWVGTAPSAQGNSATINSNGNQRSDLLIISQEAREAQAQEVITISNQEENDPFEITSYQKQKMLLLQTLLQALTGKKIKFYGIDEEANRNQEVGQHKAIRLGNNVANQAPKGWGIAYDLSESYYESERMNFSSQGTIKTTDGKEINFSIDVSISRSFAQHNSISFRAGDAVVVDPLVINYKGTSAGLSEKKFSFDLTMDGMPEQISMLKPGSGFLALDLNGDGKINDGSELFGPKTGNGFSELANYDEDGNGWIDANDSIYEKLQIWTKDDQGIDRLFAIGELGVSAIYLGNIHTPFDFKDSNQQLQGQLSRTGIFVNKNGTVGTVQQVDLAT
ncbi:hypothetical protein BHU72_12805 [Desulfuribacillus stibiiarsenatis]|uniref:VCBS repeat-containing protein n=1 Tax=Desulfuribacillus stibiiarsenatis TaxID=1390249 RepID=A0A1E5L8U9_9FIRM|nr:hypothetical protein [Desulfuribacillus stibiiarsenatis]OEH86488.1 hypothetical protein BHU72_12805 [Desulfuribacillus stibiiarsenatis]